ncbi:hypothetical protein [Streptomyces sp. NPDC046976]|uniref:hypothetical protein n=1 Tax=Streptomyces sp. NPDC046976 TaxID=3155258 RepID=UPI0033DA3633
MGMAGSFATPQEAEDFAEHLNRTAPTQGAKVRAFSGFDFSDPDLDHAASTWRSNRNENIQAAIKRARQEFDDSRTRAEAPSSSDNTPAPARPKEPESEPLKHAWDNPEALVTLTMPAAVAEHVAEAGTWPMQDPDTRKALDDAKRARNGALKVTAPLEVHHMLLEAAIPLSGDGFDAGPHEIRGYNAYAKRIAEADAERRLRRKERDARTTSPHPPASNSTGDIYDPSFQQQADANGRITHYRTPEGVSRDIAGRFGVGEPVADQFGDGWVVISGNSDGTVNVRKSPTGGADKPLGQARKFPPEELSSEDGHQPWRLSQARAADADVGSEKEGVPDTVPMLPDEVSPQPDPVRREGSKAPSGMDDAEIRDEIVFLMEREMANGGDLSGVDRTRLHVLEAEEARRAGRTPKQEPKPKPNPTEEPGGLFDVNPDEQQRFVADPNNPDDQADDPFGTPDMFADAEGRDTSRLRPPRSRKPADFQVGDRYVDTDGRTHTVKEEPIRTPRGRIRVVDEDGEEYLLAPDKELRVLHPDEDAPEASKANTPDSNASEDDARRTDSSTSTAPDSPVDGPEASGRDSGADASHGDIPPAPIGDTPPVAMSNDDIAKELDDLEAWRRRHVVPGGEGPRVAKRDLFPTVSRIGGRRGALLDQQRIREALRVREEQDAEKARRKADALKRATVGRKNADGMYPVSVDGEHLGTVEKLGSKWLYTHKDGSSSGAMLKTKGDAVAGLVQLVDFRRDQADHRAREEERRARQEAQATASAQARYGPAYSNELRVRMADIGDDIATLRRRGGLQDPERIKQLGELIRRVEDGHTEDLQGDLRHIRDEAAWLEGQFTNPDLPYESRTYKSWAVAAHRKAEAALAHPDFQNGGDTPDGPDTSAAGDLTGGDDRAARAQALFGEGMNAVGGESLPEMQELRDRLDRAGTTDDSDAELRSVADRMDELADQYELAGPQGEHAADQFRRAARIARGKDDGARGNGNQAAADTPAADAAPPRFTSVDELRDRWRSGELDEPSHPSAIPGDQARARYADNPTLELSEGGHLAIVGDPAQSGASWQIMAPGSMEPVGRAFDGDDARAYARVLEGLRDENGRPFPWDAPDAAEQARAFRGPNGESLGEAVAQQIVDRGDTEGLHQHWKRDAQRYLDRERQVDEHYDAWRAQQAADGYTVPVDIRDARAGDDISALYQGDPEPGPVTQRGRLTAPLTPQHTNRTGTWPFTHGTDYRADTEDRAVRLDPAHPDAEQRERETPFSTLTFRNTPDRPSAFRRPRPDEEQHRDQQSDHSEGDGSVSSPEADGGPEDHGDGADSTSDGADSSADNHGADASAGDAPMHDDEQENRDQDDEESRRQRDGAERHGDTDGPDDGPDGGGTGGPESPSDGDSHDREDDTPAPADEEEHHNPDRRDGEENQDEEDHNRRRRHRNRDGGPDGGGPGGAGLPHMNLPNPDDSDSAGRSNGSSGRGDGRLGNRPGAARIRDVDSLRSAWRTGEGLNPEEDTPERRAHLADLANREGLTLSPEGGLALYPEQQADGTTVWRFAQARSGLNLPGITLQTDDPEEARALAGRFEEVTDHNGDRFDWRQPQSPAAVMAWRDGEGRTLPQALRDVQDDYQRERAGAFNLPEDLTTLDDSHLEGALRQGLGPDDIQRVMAEMDRRDGYTDERIRAAVPDTPPADADEAERRGRAMDEALGFGDTDVTQPAVATPGRLRREFDSVDEERFQSAVQATGGRMLSPEAKAAGIDPRDVFSGGKYSNERARNLASPELNRWMFGDDHAAANGRLTYPQYRQREADRTLRSEFADWDEARYRQAIDATNGYFFRREYKYDDTGFDERELFSGGSLSARDRWRKYASDELQEWFDNNGGRQTFAQYKQSRRDGDRAERHQHEEEVRRAAEGIPEGGTPGGTSSGGGPSGGTSSLTADDVAPAPPFNAMSVESDEDAAYRFGGQDRMNAFADLAELRPDGDRSEGVWLGGRQIGTISNLHRANPDREQVWDAQPFYGLDNAHNSRSQSRDTAIANLVVRALENGPADSSNPSEDMWDSVTLHLAGLSHDLPELPESLRNDPVARARYDRLTRMVDAFREQQSPTGDLRQDLVQAHDDFDWLHSALEGQPRNRQRRENLSDLNTRIFWAGRLQRGLGELDSDPERPHAGGNPQGGGVPSPTAPTPDGPRSSPEENAPGAPAEAEPEAAPDPIGGRPANWARVGDLAQGDMVRMNGTTKQGRPVQRAGYVQTMPELVDVTRRSRTAQMWRTWVTANPDGTGEAGNVYTSANATAARAETPDNIAPGSPASGAQASLRSGDLPDQIPADRTGRGLFPGSTVRGTRDREGTITGATSTTVSVHWSDGSDDDSLPATSLAVTGEQRPDGWTSGGHRVTTQSIVSDSDGALLGPVGDVDGDSVTVHTADGTITRSAGGLRVTGQVSDDTPAAALVADIDEPAAADLKDGDVVVLYLDDQLATVVITGPPHRDGDRVTLQYADTTTGEMGEINVDARAVLPRAKGPDGGAPALGPDNAPDRDDDLTVYPTPHIVGPVTGPTVDPDLDSSDRTIIGDHADGPDNDTDAHQAAVRIATDLPVTPEQASALARQLRAAADPSTPEGRAALRAADHLDRATGQVPPAGLDRPRPSNIAQIGEGDLVAMPDVRHGDQMRVFRVIDAEDGPGGVRSLLLENENRQWRRRVVHGAMPVWQLPDAEPRPVNPPEVDGTDAPNTPNPPSTPDAPTLPVARLSPGNLHRGDVIDAPVSRTGYQLNGHRRLTIINEPQRQGWWMQLTGVDRDGNVHDFGLHNGRAVNVYDRNRPTPAPPPAGAPRDPNQVTQTDVDQIVSDHSRAVAARIIDEAVAGTEPPGDIHALREAIAQRLTPEALANARQATRQAGSAALDAAGITGRERANAQRRLRTARNRTHDDTVRAALRTINDLAPHGGESNEELAARAADLLRLIPDQVASRPAGDSDADPEIVRTVTGHTDAAVNALLQQLRAAGINPGDAERIARTLAQHMAFSRQATARRTVRRLAAANPIAGRQPGLVAQVVAALVRLAKRFAEIVREAVRKIAEKYEDSRERFARLRAFLSRAVRRVRQWPESRRLARLHRAVDLPDADGETLAARISHWAAFMPEPGRFGHAQRRVTFWRPTTWARLAAGRLPDRSDRIQWTPDRAADGGPGLTGLRHMAALRMAGHDVDTDVTRRLSTALGDDFGEDPHATLQHADDYVAASERRLVNLQAARSSATIPDDPDIDIEITAARSELAAARREYADLRSRYAAAVPDAVAASLADIRDMGPEGNAAIVFGPDTSPDAERAVRGVQQLIPRSWLNTPEARRITAVEGTQGSYEPEGQRVTVADLADQGLGTAGFALGEHFAQHLGDLDAAQRAFQFTRTHTGRPGARRMQRSPWDRLFRQQQTQPETGDTLARSIQAMFSGDWYRDDDLRAFLLGLLATR